MTEVLKEIRSKIAPGTAIPKPRSEGSSIVKGWGKRRDEEALIYTMPNHKHPTKRHEKFITESEWETAAEHLKNSGEFTRRWFAQYMPGCNNVGPCNFTTIGGLFQLLGYAVYDRPGVYRRI